MRPQAQTKIVAGMVAHGPPQWPQYIAEEFGWLKQDKIDLDLVTVGGGGAQQLAGGSLNIAHSGYPDFARAALQGAAMKIVINDFIGSPYAVFAKPAIKQIADLKGKLISIGSIYDITLIYIKPFLASAGLKTSDVDFVYAKAAGDRFAALALRRCRCHAPQPAELFQGDWTPAFRILATPSPMPRACPSRSGARTAPGRRSTARR